MSKASAVIVIAGALLLAFFWGRQGGLVAPKKYSSDIENKKLTGDFSHLTPFERAGSSEKKGERTRLSDELIEKLAQSENQGGLAIPGEAVIKASDQNQFHRILRDVQNHGVEIIGRLDALRAIKVRVSDAEKFANWVAKNELDASSNFFVFNPPMSPTEIASLESFTALGGNLEQWLGVEERSGEGITVAVLDSGISEHPAFQSSSIQRKEEVPDSFGSGGGTSVASFQSTEDAPVSFENGHGTAVASLIAGGIPQVIGVAPGVSLLDFPVLDADGVGDTFTLAEGIVQAAEAGAQILNLSLGASGDSLLIRDAVAFAQAEGAIVVAAAGNDGNQQLSLPAFLPGVVAVGAIDANDQILPFSNRGEGIDIAAPGLGVRTAWPEQQLIQFTGTSAATPIVSGALAVLLSQEPGLSAQEAVSILQDFSDEAGVAGEDTDFGYGVLNLSRMLNRNVSGIQDVAVVSQYLTEADQSQLNVVVENQGTETLFGIHVTTVTNGVPSSQFIQRLEPGEIAVQTSPFRAAGRDEITISSEVSGGFNDGNQENNTLQTVLVLEE